MISTKNYVEFVLGYKVINESESDHNRFPRNFFFFFFLTPNVISDTIYFFDFVNY